MLQRLFPLSFLLAFFHPVFSQNPPAGQPFPLKPNSAQSHIPNPKVLTTLAFGSCNKQTEPQDMWNFVLENKPQVWLWIGDIIYSKDGDAEAMRQDYETLKNHPLYKNVYTTTKVLGIWDDHDYGVNDGDRYNPIKQEAKALLHDFLDLPQSAAVRKREGIYDAQSYGEPGKKVKIIMLDTRWFRDSLSVDSTGNNRYRANRQADILGETQWQWLENELANNDAQFTIIANGTQIIPTDHPHEKWGYYPKARKRLFDLLIKTKTKNVLLLSGDRHMAEISRFDLQALGSPLWEVTSSGMTHICHTCEGEYNKFRIGAMVHEKNFSVLHFDWSQPAFVGLTVQIRGLRNQLFLEQKITFAR